MSGLALKQHLLRIAAQINEQTTLMDVYLLLAMLEDVEQAEAEISRDEVISNEQLKQQSRAWLN
jgi:hypothetical protein